MAILTLFLSISGGAYAQIPFADAVDGYLHEQEEAARMLTATPDASAFVALAPEEQKFFSLINQFREELHLTPLHLDTRLQAAAFKHNAWMMDTGHFTHEGPDRNGTVGTRAAEEGIVPTILTSEIIATGSFSAKDTFLQWFFSPDHLQAMINDDLDHLGISRTGCDEKRPHEEGNCFWTVDFAGLEDRLGVPYDQTEEAVLDAGEAIVGPLDGRKDNFSLKESVPARVLGGLKNATNWLSPK